MTQLSLMKRINTLFRYKRLVRFVSNRAIIIGGGPCGALTALSLQKQGIDSIIFERSIKNNYQYGGSGMMLHGGTECIKYLGYKNELYSISSPAPKQVIYKTMDNKIYMQFDPDVMRQYNNIEIRGVLRKNLVGKLQDICNQTDGIEYITDKQLINYTQTDDKVTVYFNDDTEYEGDVLLGCDGINSKVREIMKGRKISNECKIYSGYSFWYMDGKLDKDFIYPQDIDKTTVITQTGDSCFGLFVPYLTKQLNDYSMVFGYKSDIDLEGSNYGGWGAETTKQQLLDWSDEYGFNTMSSNNNGIFEKGIEKAIKVSKFNIHRIVIDKQKHGKWYDDRVILLGDAAHAITPFGGHGCNLAIYDAICLGYLVGKYKNNLNGNYKNIFKELYDIRCDHSYEIGDKALKTGQLYAIPKNKHFWRDNVLGMISKLGIIRKMAGKMQNPVVGFDIISCNYDR